MKVDFITLYADQTHSVKKVDVEGDKVKVSRSWQPKIIVGKSVFPEREPTGKLNWLQRQKQKTRKKKRFVIGVYGSEFCYSLSEDLGKLDEHWSTDEGEKFINKVIAWAAAKAKLFSKMEIYVFWILLMANLVVTFLMFRRIGF